MFYLIITLIIIALILLLYLLSYNASDYQGALQAQEIRSYQTKAINDIEKLEEKLSSRFVILPNLVGKNFVYKLIIPSFLILITSVFIFGPWLTNYVYGVFLGLVMAFAYILRIFYHHSAVFRSKALSQLERILLNIRNNLSTGMTLDYAVFNTLKFNSQEPLGPLLAKFIKLSEMNFLENFPLWLKNLELSFNLKDLGKSAQLLDLELKYTNNQEEAFINAAKNLTDRISINHKQNNTVLMTFFTMDFMVLSFLGILFFVVPNIGSSPELSWWHSSSRPLVVFITGLCIWGAYLLTVGITIWRQK